jgi:hypothetical protein
VAEKPFKVKNDLVVGRGVIVDSDLTVKGNSVIEGTLQAVSLTGVYTGFDSDLATKTTTDVTEGSNLYYTTARADSDFDVRLATKTTTDVAEGTNLYYTTTRFDSDLGDKTTTDVAEGTNLYYTTSRADSDFDVRLATKSTTNLAEGDNLYYTTARADSDAKRAISVTDAGGDGSLSYNPATGIVTYTGPSASEVRAHFSGGTGVTITDGVVAIGQAVSTTSDVTFAKITGDSANLDGILFRQRPNELTTTPGALYYDSEELGGLTFRPRTREGATDNKISLGMQNVIYVHNLTGGVVSRGDVVYISGTAHNKHPEISLAQANAFTAAHLIAVASTDIANYTHGYVTKFGLVDGLDTSLDSEGADVYLSADSAGKWTTTPVTLDTGYPIIIGKVIKVSASTGTILVDPFSENFYDLRIENRLKVTGKIEGDSASLSQIDFNTLYAEHIAYKEGSVWYDNVRHTLNFWGDDSNVVHEIGIEEHQRVYNNSGSIINKGSPLYYSGNYDPGGAQPVPTVGLADATDVNAYNAQGLAASDIGIDEYGYVILSGLVENINTSGLTAGQNFFVGLTPGAIQNQSPTYPNFPMCLGWVVKSDASTGTLLVNQQNHSVNTFRVRGNTHIGADLRVDGNLLVIGTQTVASTANVSIGGNFQFLNAGDTIGQANTNFIGTGLNDGEFTSHYIGDSDNKSFFVKIDSAGATDTFEWGFDSAVGTQATGILITGNDQILDSNYGISINFGAVTGHTLGDKWAGTATATDIDTGFFSNRNEGEAGDGYTHVGLFFDVSDDKWRLVSKYDSEPEAPINVNSPSYQTGTLVANIEGSVTGGITGNAGTATALQTSRNFSLTGDITAAVQGFDGTGNVILTTVYNPGSIVNADINAAAGIVDTKLATISTAGKVQNSATTATNANTASAIVARDGSGNFSAGVITASLTGNVTGTVSDISNHTTTALSEGSNLYYTTTRADSDFDVRLATKTTADVTENTNLYYTTSRADSDFDVRLATKTTTDLTEGSNLYYLTARADSDAKNAISVTDAGGDGSLSYNAGLGVLTYTGPSAAEVRAHFSGTSPVAIAAGAISVNNATTSTKGIASFNSASFSAASGAISIKSAGVSNAQLANSAITINGASVSLGGTRTLVTDNIAEDGSPTNLWFTNTRARGAISITDAGGDGSLAYASATGVITYTGPSATEVRAHFNVNDTNLAYDSATGKFTFGATPSFTRITLSQGSGTAPMTVSSTTVVTNLNADLLDGQQGSYYRINVYNAAGSLLN